LPRNHGHFDSYVRCGTPRHDAFALIRRINDNNSAAGHGFALEESVSAADPDDEYFDRLITKLYATASSEDQLWQPVIEGLVRAVGARTGWVLVRSDSGDVEVLGSVGIGTEAMDTYLSHYLGQDPWARAARRAPEGAILHSHDYIDPDTLVRSEFYTDWIRPHYDDSVWGIASPVLVAAWGRITLATHRLRPAGAFIQSETRAFGRLTPHLRTALTLRHRLQNIDGERALGLDVLAAVDTAALVLDAAGRIRFASPAAEEILRARDGLLTSNNALQVAARVGQARLDEAIARAADPTAPVGTMLRLSRSSSATEWILLVAPFDSSAAQLGARRVLCLIRDPDRDLTPRQWQLTRAFGLTAAEARVAAAIAQGKSLEMIAEEFGVSRNTVRNQTQQVLGKTGATRQAQLVRLLLSLPTASAR
jgi:DNA-binding CsgD family transcriptional regulator/PAS domain-containing protein